MPEPTEMTQTRQSQSCLPCFPTTKAFANRFPLFLLLPSTKKPPCVPYASLPTVASGALPSGNWEQHTLFSMTAIF